MQQQMHKKTNIIHMLNMEIKEQGAMVSNTQAHDLVSKNDHLLSKTKNFTDELSDLRDALKLKQNEVYKEKSDIRSKDDQRMGLLVQEKMLDTQIEQIQKQISGLKKERELTKESNSFVNREIVLKNEKKSEQEIDASRKLQNCEQADSEIQ